MWLRSDVAVLWCRPAAAAMIQPLAQELPYAKAKKKKKKKKKGQREGEREICTTQE